jgi:DNA-binding XRE family transcriptional regulator
MSALDSIDSLPPVPVYRHIAGCPGYAVDSIGNVISCRQTHRTDCGMVPGINPNRWHILNCASDSDGYLTVHIRGGELTARHSKVHRIVLETFVGPAPDGCQACHRNGVRTDNRVENLYWGTAADNSADRHRHGNTQRGERHTAARLTEKQVREIRAAMSLGATTTELAKVYGVTNNTIGHINRRKTWKHLE